MEEGKLEEKISAELVKLLYTQAYAIIACLAVTVICIVYGLYAVLAFAYLAALLFISYRLYQQKYANIKLKYENEASKSQFDTILGAFSLISDMTPRINYLATHDFLTNLPNRSLFHASLAHALREGHENHTQVALLFLDLDHFKTVNDSLGHDVGDQLLVDIVERLQRCVHENDMIARLGGDEFVVVMKDGIELERPMNVAKKICKCMEKVFTIGDKVIYITASVGISLYPDDGNDIQTLMKNADMAMYRAKERGRNTFEFYTQGMNESIQRKICLETSLRDALEKRELKVYYQPIINIHNNVISSMEALLRWDHPHFGFVRPDEFIPIAEETDLIVPINEWVLRTACKQNRFWQREGFSPLKVALNLSMRQFLRRDFINTLIKILTETGLTGKNLVLELSERLIISDIEHSVKVIKSLKELDVTISLDDFGIGYLNLSCLKRIPFDIIKIDRSFMTDFYVGSHDAAIVSAIIAMGHHLKMKVVAVGVEKPEQYLFLKNHGCDEVQGYLLCPPLSELDIIPVLASCLIPA